MLRHALLALALLGLLAGCGRHEHPSAAPGGELTFEQLDRLRDTTGLSAGAALLRHFEPYRLPNHVMRVRGEMNLPDGTVLQIAVFPPGSHAAVARVQFELRGHRFDTPPIMGSRGPLPQDRYHFEMITFFDSSWQPATVVDALGDGSELRGPGVTRDRQGRAAYSFTEDRRL